MVLFWRVSPHPTLTPPAEAASRKAGASPDRWIFLSILRVLLICYMYPLDCRLTFPFSEILSFSGLSLTFPLPSPLSGVSTPLKYVEVGYRESRCL